MHPLRNRTRWCQLCDHRRSIPPCKLLELRNLQSDLYQRGQHLLRKWTNWWLSAMAGSIGAAFHGDYCHNHVVELDIQRGTACQQDVKCLLLCRVQQLPDIPNASNSHIQLPLFPPTQNNTWHKYASSLKIKHGKIQQRQWNKEWGLCRNTVSETALPSASTALCLLDRKQGAFGQSETGLEWKTTLPPHTHWAQIASQKYDKHQAWKNNRS